MALDAVIAVDGATGRSISEAESRHSPRDAREAKFRLEPRSIEQKSPSDPKGRPLKRRRCEEPQAPKLDAERDLVALTASLLAKIHRYRASPGRWDRAIERFGGMLAQQSADLQFDRSASWLRIVRLIERQCQELTCLRGGVRLEHLDRSAAQLAEKLMDCACEWTPRVRDCPQIRARYETIANIAPTPGHEITESSERRAERTIHEFDLRLRRLCLKSSPARSEGFPATHDLPAEVILRELSRKWFSRGARGAIADRALKTIHLIVAAMFKNASFNFGDANSSNSATTTI